MSDRRKDMWRLLYNLVNRNETQLGDVFGFVDDILCKEPSLIRQSSRDSTNRFQDAFILWLINKLVGSLVLEQENETDIIEMNLKIQRKLLNSCLVNRSSLFEQVITAYSRAIDQLTEAYSQCDLSLDSDDSNAVLEITAFSTQNHDLEEIDPDFSFPVIQVQCNSFDDYVHALLQVLHHGLFVGYINYPLVFEESILIALKALKEGDFATKLICLQYVNKVFQRAMFLSDKLRCMYELCFRTVVSMWNYLPIWLSNQYLAHEVVDDFVEGSSSLLGTLYKFIDEISEKHMIESYCFQLLENMHEVFQSQGFQTMFDHAKISVRINVVIDFLFSLHMQNPPNLQRINPVYVGVLLKVVKTFPTVLRAIPPYLMCSINEEVLIIITKFVTLEVTNLLTEEMVSEKHDKFLNECLSFLFLLEHLFKWNIQAKKENNDKLKESEYFRRSIDQISQIVSTTIMSEHVNVWLSKYQNHDAMPIDFLRTVGLFLDINLCFSILPQNVLDKLIEIVLKPTSTGSTLIHSQYDFTDVETSLQILAQLRQSSVQKYSKIISNSLISLGKFLFEVKNQDLNITTMYAGLLPNFIVNNCLKVDMVANDLLKKVRNEEILINTVKALCCFSGTPDILMVKCLSYPKRITADDYPKLAQVSVECTKCCYASDSACLKLRIPCCVDFIESRTQCLPLALKAFVSKHLFTNPRMNFINNHLEFCDISVEDLLEALFSGSDAKRIYSPTVGSVIAKCIQTRTEFLTQLSARLLSHVTESLKSNRSYDYQRTMLMIISSCTQSALLSEQWLFHFFKMTFFYLIHPESKVVHEAILCAAEMCISNNKKPIHLWNWYKRDALNLIVRLMVYVYLSKGLRMTKSLNAFTKMLGFSCVEEFVCKYYRLLVTMILPFCVKEPRCKGLIISISKITRKPVVDLFVVSFLRIYTHIYLTEEADIGNSCIELIGKCTGESLSKLMNTDIQQTVCEFLVYFNRSPTFVMQAFRCLLPNEPGTSKLCSKSPTHDFTEFIKLRFLGVITYFQTCLAETYFEKPLKEETLYSLGQIMRLIGSNSVTQFRFKIIAMLSFVLTLDDRNMQNICLKIWNIFLHIVSIQELGPSLSRIVASLLPLIDTNPDEINSIYEYLILKNDSLLGVYIPDLYFLDDVAKVKPIIRQSVARQTELSNKERGNVSEKLKFLYKQICNENLEVRIYGLKYLAIFVGQHRREINHMILDAIPVDPLIEQIVDELIKGCRHDDRNMHLASAKCLGELGAIDPSYMSSSFSYHNSSEISLSIHTDDFAIMALTELCRAYQFQKDSKYVDNFSLAIQETLSAFGISPDENKKLNIWEALPVRMQQIMKPLLSSCYTGSKRQIKITEHPLFNSSSCRSYEEWSFAWSCRLIDLVEKEETRHLLNSYKLSMKRDSSILAIFFPYILLHVLQEGRVNGIDKIFEEFMAVFKFSSRDISSQTEVDTYGYKEFKSTKYSADSSSSNRESSSTASEQFEGMDSVIQTCTKLCSEQIDFLQRWVGDWHKANATIGKLIQENNNYKAVTEFLARFKKSLISKANFNCGEYARALLYLEEYIEEDPSGRLQDQLSFLIQIHGKLMDSDSVEGAVYMKKINLTLEEEILVNRLVDRPHETITCYEQLLSRSEAQINQDHIKGIIDCYLRMDTPETALLITDGLWQKLADQYTDDYFKECKSELLWRLGRYDELQELLEDNVVKRKTSNWNIQCAESFLLFRQPNILNENTFETFVEQLNVIRSNIVGTMRSCSGVLGNSYTHSYDEATRLHLLNEVEKNKHLIIQIQTSKNTAESNCEESIPFNVQEYFDNWDARLEVLQSTARVLEPILCFRRNLLMETQRILLQDACGNKSMNAINEYINEQIVKLWLRSIQMNRESGCLQQAQICIMKAEQYNPATLFLEKAKLLWQKGDQANCFKLLQKNIKMLFSKCNGNVRSLVKSHRILYAEAKFLQAYYNAESMNICQELNLKYYKEAVDANNKSEKCQVHYAQYMEKIYESFTREHKESENGCNVLIDIMFCYARSLKFGCANVYQSLPRLLSIWLNFTSHLVSAMESVQPGSSQSAKQLLLQGLGRKMNELMNNCATNLPASIFYTALSQLLSRICHPSADVFKNIKTIVMKLIDHFPQQTLWMLLPIFKSCHTTRAKRCRLILSDPVVNKPPFKKLLNDFNMLTERLIELTNKDLAIDHKYELSSLVRQLPRLFQDRQFSNIMLPFEKYMQASFPIMSSADSLNFRSSMTTSSLENSGNSSVPSNPFPSCVYICGINEDVVVLRSAAKPKKITIECNDGLFYNIMVKPKDDLRKDFRLMEFNGLVKRYLHQDPQARHRRLRIRTYAAIPFNEECGLVEWLPNLNSFRGICMSFYRMRNLGIPDKMLRQYALPKTDPIESKRNVFTDVLLARHPPVFHEWFRQRFPSPHCWYQARSSYVKTVAVMSMVGYILGLGDRHGENILFDETNGDAVHVDFNCLFNQGETFAYPENVPFRLTHNMIFAMGPLAAEGLFRRCCEISLRVLKGESKTLMSVLRPFVYDIGSINRLKGKTNTALEITDPKAITDVKRIEERLQGYVKRTQGCNMPLSTEGHVNFLINEATEIDNLAAMYIGWGSYI